MQIIIREQSCKVSTRRRIIVHEGAAGKFVAGSDQGEQRMGQPEMGRRLPDFGHF